MVWWNGNMSDLPHLSMLLSDMGLELPPGLADVPVTGVAYDSRKVEKGNIFVAIPGRHADGQDFIAAAVDQGAVAVVLGQEHGRLPLSQGSVAAVEVEDSRRALSALAAAFFGHPSREMHVLGVTGTDGKSTTSAMIHAALQHMGVPAGLLSTVTFGLADRLEPNPTRQTTLEAPELQGWLSRARQEGITHAVVETSSHGLALFRVEDICYRTAVYTTITSEHLDFHGTREAYLAAKAHLAEITLRDRSGRVVLNADDAYAFPPLLALSQGRSLSYGVSNPVADVCGYGLSPRGKGTALSVDTPWGAVELSVQLPGRFNVENALAALTAVAAAGYPLEEVAAGISSFPGVTGRMQAVDLGQPFSVVVDYAHTEAALRLVLSSLREATGGKLWVVFGSAGERDLGKRPAMGHTAALLADMVILTDEDPRGEDSMAILGQIAQGARKGGAKEGETLFLIPDRKEAIWYAISRAKPGDTVLLAGKGHEQSILTATGPVPWSDVDVVTEALQESFGRHA